jgi:hypothetical protein
MKPNDMAMNGASRKSEKLFLNVFSNPIKKATPYKPPANQSRSRVS